MNLRELHQCRRESSVLDLLPLFRQSPPIVAASLSIEAIAECAPHTQHPQHSFRQWNGESVRMFRQVSAEAWLVISATMLYCGTWRAHLADTQPIEIFQRLVSPTSDKVHNHLHSMTACQEHVLNLIL